MHSFFTGRFWRATRTCVFCTKKGSAVSKYCKQLPVLDIIMLVPDFKPDGDSDSKQTQHVNPFCLDASWKRKKEWIHKKISNVHDYGCHLFGYCSLWKFTRCLLWTFYFLIFIFKCYCLLPWHLLFILNKPYVYCHFYFF